MEDQTITSKILLVCIIVQFICIMALGIKLNYYERTDINHDGKTDIKDLLIVQKKILESSDE